MGLCLEQYQAKQAENGFIVKVQRGRDQNPERCQQLSNSVLIFGVAEQIIFRVR